MIQGGGGQVTLREFDRLCLPPVEPLQPEQIEQIRPSQPGSVRRAAGDGRRELWTFYPTISPPQTCRRLPLGALPLLMRSAQLQQ